MNLGLLFNTLGAAIFDGIPEDAQVEIITNYNETSNYYGGMIESIWLDEKTLPPTLKITSYRAPRRGQKVLWEEQSEKV